jgi:prolyl oligopeptidase
MQAAGNRNLLVPSATNRGLKLLCRAALLIISSALFTRPASAQNPPAPAKCPPATRVDTAKDIYGSTVVADPYRWLEDQNSPETRAWIDAEQKCTESVLSTLPGRANSASG